MAQTCPEAGCSDLLGSRVHGMRAEGKPLAEEGIGPRAAKGDYGLSRNAIRV
ncbi:hypothetical protein GCM10010885_19410 [Alicyclobacillus cellulosilyticus]|uniref:Uncharacterized protein n=1 Tax=Alicyclobacillus cellulosilyticus TaxID=1003997 RepID=A0A917KFL6_9BACL|nr:hypothetical protein GCM10010885_19410 [Alicyclobacillus cellulosilyticus]